MLSIASIVLQAAGSHGYLAARPQEHSYQRMTGYGTRRAQLRGADKARINALGAASLGRVILARVK
jgi:hypothetical protein